MSQAAIPKKEKKGGGKNKASKKIIFVMEDSFSLWCDQLWSETAWRALFNPSQTDGSLCSPPNDHHQSGIFSPT